MSKHEFSNNDIVIDENGLYYDITNTDKQTDAWLDSNKEPAYELKRLNTKIGMLQSRTFLEPKKDFEKKYTFYSYLPRRMQVFLLRHDPLCPVYVMITTDLGRNMKGKGDQRTFIGFSVNYVVLGGADMGPEKLEKLCNDKSEEIRDHNKSYWDKGKTPPTLGTKIFIEKWLSMKPERVPWSSLDDDGEKIKAWFGKKEITPFVS